MLQRLTPRRAASRAAPASFLLTLCQERPNVFTQSAAGVMPGERATVVVSHVETLKYEAGT